MALSNRPRLGVNVDHIATVRQARGTTYPDPVAAAAVAELAGADQITVHLREDRRHIQDRDVRILRQTVQTRLNLEMSGTPEMARFAMDVRPHMITLVPEKREERTTEGGLDVAGRVDTMAKLVATLRQSGAFISMFIDPNETQVQASKDIGADIIELHTGDFCQEMSSFSSTAAYQTHQAAELKRLAHAASLGAKLGLVVAAGHGLDYKNVYEVAAIAEIEEFNIGHSIMARAFFVGLDAAVREMQAALDEGRSYGR